MGKQLSEQATQLGFEAVDYAAKNIQSTQDSFTPFILTLNETGKASLCRTPGSPEEVFAAAQTVLDRHANDLVAYAIAQDGYTQFDGPKRDTIMIEAGCIVTGLAANMFQQYSMEYDYQEFGNVQVDFNATLRVSNSDRDDTREDGELAPFIQAPFAIFQKVAGADGQIDEDETRAFMASFKKGLDVDSLIVNSCVTEGAKNARQYFEMIQQGLIDPDTELKTLREAVMKKFGKAESSRYLQFLTDLADDIAQPKGGFMGFGKKVSNIDSDAVKQVKALLQKA